MNGKKLRASSHEPRVRATGLAQRRSAWVGRLLADSLGFLHVICGSWCSSANGFYACGVALPRASLPRARAIRCTPRTAHQSTLLRGAAPIANACLRVNSVTPLQGLDLIMGEDPRAAPWAIDFAPVGLNAPALLKNQALLAILYSRGAQLKARSFSFTPLRQKKYPARNQRPEAFLSDFPTSGLPDYSLTYTTLFPVPLYGKPPGAIYQPSYSGGLPGNHERHS
jgi:hypothetical protein